MIQKKTQNKKKWGKSILKLRVLFLCLSLLVILAGCSDSSGTTNRSSAEGKKSESEKTVDFPKKPINLVVGFAAGGTYDITGRAVAEFSQKYLDQPIIVVNREGAGGTIALGESAKEKPDGYTVVLGHGAGFLTQPNLREVSYSLDDFKVLTSVSTSPNVLVVNDDSPYHSLKDFTDGISSRKEPLQLGIGGLGAFSDLAARTLFSDLDIEYTNVPFQGNGPTAAALLGNHVEAAMVFPSDVTQYVQEGKMRILGIFTPERLEEIPEVPTMKELTAEMNVDYKYADFDFSAPLFLLVPKETPEGVVEILSEAFKNVLNDSDMKEFAEKTEMILRVEDGDQVFEGLSKDTETYKTIFETYKIGEQ